MTSDAAPASGERRIYVGLAAQAGTGTVPAGLLKVVRHGVMESGEFAYGRRYLQLPEARALNPAQLPLRDATFVLPARRLRDGGALPLTLHDALPDAWGRKVLEMRHGPLSDLDALLLTNEDRVGAMVFSEALPIVVAPASAEVLSLEALADASRRLEAGLETTPDMQRLLRGGASLGGARPKATFVHRGRRHIAKFASRADEYDMEVVEAATLALARACGIDVPPFVLQPLAQGHALLLERFDRSGPLDDERRLPYLSASALLDVPYASSGGSYLELAQALRRHAAQPEDDVAELFRRMVFNLAAGNSDDHVKNHGVLQRPDGGWYLAPAFDLVAQLSAHTGYQELAILPGAHASSLDLARRAAPHFGLSPQRADAVIARILEVVRQQAHGAVRAAGGGAGLATRLQDFVVAQAGRIAG